MDPLMQTGAGSFPPTRLSVIELAGNPEGAGFKEAWETFFRAYWPPLYGYLRRTGSTREQACDLLQDFLLEGLEAGLLTKFQPGRAKLRTFLLACLRNQRNEVRRHEKVRPDRRPLPFLSTENVENTLADPSVRDPEEVYEEEWQRQVYLSGLAILEERLKAGGDTLSLRILREWVLAEERRPAAELAAELKISTGDLSTRGTRMRDAIRQAVEEQVRNYCTTSVEVIQERDAVLRQVTRRSARKDARR